MVLIADFPQDWQVPVRIADGEICEIDPQDSVEYRPNFVFAARLEYLGRNRSNTRSVRHIFRDVDSGLTLRFSPKTIESLVKALFEGRVAIENGVLEGHFTFVKYYDYYFATPLEEADAAGFGLL